MDRRLFSKSWPAQYGTPVLRCVSLFYFSFKGSNSKGCLGIFSVFYLWMKCHVFWSMRAGYCCGKCNELLLLFFCELVCSLISELCWGLTVSNSSTDVLTRS